MNVPTSDKLYFVWSSNPIDWFQIVSHVDDSNWTSDRSCKLWRLNLKIFTSDLSVAQEPEG